MGMHLANAAGQLLAARAALRRLLYVVRATDEYRTCRDGSALAIAAAEAARVA